MFAPTSRLWLYGAIGIVGTVLQIVLLVRFGVIDGYGGVQAMILAGLCGGVWFAITFFMGLYSGIFKKTWIRSLTWAVALTGMLSAYNMHLVGKVSEFPAIHDITTDTVDPPQWVALLDDRQAARNGADYAGAEIAEQQSAAFPDIATLALPLTVAAATEKADRVLSELGIAIVEADIPGGRIEGTATTFVMQFQDDVVVRVREKADESGVLVDVRSMSRVGVSDLGVNAARVRAILAAMATD